MRTKDSYYYLEGRDFGSLEELRDLVGRIERDPDQQFHAITGTIFIKSYENAAARNARAAKRNRAD